MDQELLLSHLVATLERLKIPYAIGGSHAVMAYGEPRHTRDIDVVAEIDAASLPQLSLAFPPEDYYTSDTKAAVARGGMFNIIHPVSGQKIDFFVPSDDFEKGEIARARRMPISVNESASFVSPEDVIIMKMRYYEMGESDKHLRDSASILQKLGDKVDRGYINEQAKSFGLEPIWAMIVKRADNPGEPRG